MICKTKENDYKNWKYIILEEYLSIDVFKDPLCVIYKETLGLINFISWR